MTYGNDIANITVDDNGEMVKLSILSIPPNKIVDLNTVPGSENIKSINCPSVTASLRGRIVKKLILPQTATEVRHLNLADNIACKMQLKELVWPAKTEIIPPHLFDHGLFASISNIGGVKEIGEEAFAHSLLEEFTIPPNVKKIPSKCFSLSFALKEVNRLENIEEIGEGAFEGCIVLQKVSWPQKCSIIPSRCFRLCHALSEIGDIKNVKDIGEMAFNGCNIKKISWPAECKVVRKWCFMCSGLEEISGIEEVEDIGEGAFCGTKISTFQWPQKCHKVNHNCFTACKELTEITGLNNIFSIGDCAFKFCGISKMDLSQSSCAVVGEYSFCSSSIKEFIPGYYTSIGKNAFINTELDT